MLQKVVIGLLILTVVGAIALGIRDANGDDNPTTEVLRAESVPTADIPPTEVPTEVPTTISTPAEVASMTDAPPVETVVSDTSMATPVQVQQQNSINMVGESWQGSGVVVALDDVGLTLDSGVYVELAPNFYWAGIPLSIGDSVMIEGFQNGDQYHTQTLTLTMKGDRYIFRTADGQPLWSGGAENNGSTTQNGGNTAQNNGNGQQIPMTEWQTFTGTLATVTNNSLALHLNDGQVITLQLGQPRFRDEQAVTLMDGDFVEVSGYWQGDQFRVGTLTKTATNETLLLLDPNGRPLWGGPGRSVNETGGSGQGQGASAQDSTGGGQGQSSTGGNGYRGGRDTTGANQ